jgi:hypothetical protein
MLTKQGATLVFYTAATAAATAFAARMGPAHVATHQIALLVLVGDVLVRFRFCECASSHEQKHGRYQQGYFAN